MEEDDKNKERRRIEEDGYPTCVIFSLLLDS